MFEKIEIIRRLLGTLVVFIAFLGLRASFVSVLSRQPTHKRNLTRRCGEPLPVLMVALTLS